MATANLLQTSVSGGTQNALSLQGDGVFFPKASTTSRLALTLTTTDKGFIVYDTTDNNIYFWNGAAWESVPSSGDAGANGSVQYNDNGIVSGASNFTYNKATGAVSIAGDLTVDTNVLKVDSALNKVGIGVATLTGLSTLNVAGDVAITSDLVLKNGSGTAQGYIFGSSGLNYRVIASNPHVWQEGGTDLMRLNSTGLGIGASPSYKLEVVAPAGDNIVSLFRSGDATAANNAGGGFQSTSSATAANRLARVWLDADGANLSSGDYFFIQKNGNSGTADILQYSNAAMRFGANYGNRLTFDMTIDASGNLLVGVPTTPPALAVNSQMVFNLTSNTNLRISVRGTDGTTRTANITLA